MTYCTRKISYARRQFVFQFLGKFLLKRVNSLLVLSLVSPDPSNVF